MKSVRNFKKKTIVLSIMLGIAFCGNAYGGSGVEAGINVALNGIKGYQQYGDEEKLKSAISGVASIASSIELSANFVTVSAEKIKTLTESLAGGTQLNLFEHTRHGATLELADKVGRYANALSVATSAASASVDIHDFAKSEKTLVDSMTLFKNLSVTATSHVPLLGTGVVIVDMSTDALVAQINSLFDAGREASVSEANYYRTLHELAYAKIDAAIIQSISNGIDVDNDKIVEIQKMVGNEIANILDGIKPKNRFFDGDVAVNNYNRLRELSDRLIRAEFSDGFLNGRVKRFTATINEIRIAEKEFVAAMNSLMSDIDLIAELDQPLQSLRNSLHEREKLHSIDHSKFSEKAISDAISNKTVDVTRTIETTRKLELDRQLARFDVDIFFLADNTGSMGGLVGSAKTNAQAILDALRTDARFSKVNAQFGVGMFLGDPSEWGETATSAYQLLQPITNNDAQITTAINQWYASGGGDWEEANFYAIHQVITQGAAVPRDATLKSNQVTGWRPGAAKVIVVFGDAPSWQNSVNEKELKDLVRTTGARIVFIDTSQINVGQQSNVFAASSGRQMQDAALEIADASGGSYMHLSDVSKIKEAVLDSVYDAIADNNWGGGMLARIDAGTTWRSRTPSSVTAESTDGGKTLVFTLRYPNQPNATFSVDTSVAGKVYGHEYYQGAITGATNIFSKNMNTDSVFHINAAQDFFRFVLRGESGVVEGYFGERLSATTKLPTSGVSTYDLRHRVISPYDNNAYAAGGMKLFVNWTSGKVYGFESNASLAGGTGTALFIGDIDRSGLEIDGQYVFKTRRLTTAENSSIPRYIRDAMRETTSLQFYGSAYPNGLGGTFGSTFYNEAGSPTLSSMLMSGYVNEKTVTKPYSPANNEVWSGYAVGLVANRSTGAVAVAYNTNPNDVQMTLRPVSATAKADITVRDGGTAYNFGSDWSDTSVYINKDAFAAIKEINGVPSYAATTMTEDDGYNYLSWGVWSTELVATPNTSVMDGSHWIAGTLTPTTSMPVTGSATYTGQIRGTAHEGGALHALNGSTNLTANFGTGNISGQLNVQYANTGAAYATSNLSGVTISGNQFGGSLSGSNNAGAIQGGFFGPAAQEVGGNWAIEKTSGSKAAGVFSGKR
ncbi:MULTISPECIES: transferrin-binding protein-like solute binding protein [Nitrincola]|uniref:Transferrin binding protein-like solute binding protein n=1 Tax=Nitrincola nitratireducens TaxID=1229521 RepID=W9V5M9_9GAMM|nr:MULTISPECIES: transferrin-binding protein-like solute binding protein [Nitrincola]EXJ11407.1 Transferrin binding protein-like solute binding protein [Nitrincola nitratireducens]